MANGYADRKLLAAIFSATGTMTATASDHAVTQTGVAKLPEFPQATQIHRVVVRIVTAPGAGAPGTKLIFLNGTDTFAVATIGTKTAGQTVEVVTTQPYDRIGENVAPTVNILSTGTASSDTGITNGAHNIFFEV